MVGGGGLRWETWPRGCVEDGSGEQQIAVQVVEQAELSVRIDVGGTRESKVESHDIGVEGAITHGEGNRRTVSTVAEKDGMAGLIKGTPQDFHSMTIILWEEWERSVYQQVNSQSQINPYHMNDHIALAEATTPTNHNTRRSVRRSKHLDGIEHVVKVAFIHHYQHLAHSCTWHGQPLCTSFKCGVHHQEREWGVVFHKDGLVAAGESHLIEHGRCAALLGGDSDGGILNLTRSHDGT